MGVDEQKEEREVLDAIFPDEITGTTVFQHTENIACGLLGDEFEIRETVSME